MALNGTLRHPMPILTEGLSKVSSQSWKPLMPMQLVILYNHCQLSNIRRIFSLCACFIRSRHLIAIFRLLELSALRYCTHISISNHHHMAAQVDRNGSNSGEPIAINNHMITHELPWQVGAKVPASVPPSSFHTFSVSGQSVQQRTRKPSTAAKRAKVNAVRKMTACLNCRHAKAPVSHRRE